MIKPSYGLKALALAVFVASAGFVGAADRTLNVQSSTGSSADDYAPPEPIDNGVLIGEIGGTDLYTQLSPSEKLLLDAKIHALLLRQYEQQELGRVMEVIGDINKEEEFNRHIEETYSLTPEQIKLIRSLEQKEVEARNAPIKPVEMVIDTVELDIDAQKPIDLHVSPGNASSIVFFDETGEPWPIEGDIIGNADAFGSQITTKYRHTGVFNINQDFAQSNALVNLVDLELPVVIRLVGTSDSIHVRRSVRVLRFGPNAEDYHTSSPQIQASDPKMLAVLDHDLRKLGDAKRYELVGVPGDAFYSDGYLYIRTRANLISPPDKERLTGPSGYMTYKISPVSSLLFSYDGEMKEVSIEESFEVDLPPSNSIFK